ncbi:MULTISPECIES: hypothetical protein [unclassified Moorena]|uniref:hypothetical protein n=1 Tax=unclassified Moorena TaxID=2683338 RepID=UPI0013C8A4A1|nr:MULTISPECIES: hypothetical protein [unclassified Moorena]NEO19693.1 hypothetical protein [Moorena sp. SIO4A5]NEQ58724.1 hypothetical protein [Moorena sp. SIO4A1]
MQETTFNLQRINLGQKATLREQPQSRLENKKIRDLHALSDGLRPAFSERMFGKQ